MRLPIRIQRRRARGWRMPAHTKYVGRGSLYGNPYRVARSARELEEGGELVVASADEAVARYREWIEQTREGRFVASCAARNLWGLDLACWCKLDQPCHADVLLEIANREVSASSRTVITGCGIETGPQNDKYRQSLYWLRRSRYGGPYGARPGCACRMDE